MRIDEDYIKASVGLPRRPDWGSGVDRLSILIADEAK